MYEILTLAQTQKLSKKLAVVLYGPDYWNEVMDIGPMAKWGMIAPDDLGYLQPASTPEEAFTILRDFLVSNHLVPATTQEQKTPGIAKTQS
jgi:predicted Rossmann-fold nucleotide-binding protein